MGSTRKAFTPDYRAEAVQYVLTSTQPIAEVARNLGIAETTSGKSVSQARENNKPELTISERAELKHLRKEIQTVKPARA